MKPVETMAGHLHKVTYKEQLIICHAVRQRTEDMKYAHLSPALLPFVSLFVVKESLRYVTNSRPVAVINSKLKPEIDQDHTGPLALKRAKVVRVFGPSPEKGRIFNWLPTIEGISKRVAIKPAGRGIKGSGRARFQVIVAKEYREAVRLWCIDNLN